VTTALAVRNVTNLSIEAISKYGEVFKASGMFPDIKSTAQAVVKIQAGAELGLPPFQAMKAVHIIQGNCTLAGNTIAAMVKSHPRYDYVLEESTDKVCKGYFVDRQANTKHPHEYTWQDAERAGDTKKDNYRKHPAAMLFNRWISSGQKKYAPDATNGVLVYTPDELGGQIDHEGAYIETTAEVINSRDAQPTVGDHQHNRYLTVINRAVEKGLNSTDVANAWTRATLEAGASTDCAAEITPEQFETAFNSTCLWCKSAIEEMQAKLEADMAHGMAESATVIGEVLQEAST
jgi:hypothetical protein